MFDLTGKGALVTGATGGIGRAIAKALHTQGAHVAISGTRAERLDELAKELGDRVTPLPCDLRDRAAVVKLGEDAEKALGQVDILVNNAGITHDNLFMRMKDEEWDDVIAVNLTSVFTLTRGILRNMMRWRAGRIVNIASISGVLGNPGQPNYA
ncbi:MAG: SDR family NAD(P)-dependent oxidoreductase, partial [Planctomycetes bacterium]|nr:SDR family NAD(P)-dependent oxidoreductase [Planctomycetota bacterium]